MERMTTFEVEILKLIGGFCIQVCMQSTIPEYHHDIQEWDSLRADAFIRRFEYHTMPVVVCILQELVKLLLTMGPNEKYVVYVSELNKLFQWVVYY